MNEGPPQESTDARGAEAQPRDGQRIYAASLSDYNSGILHGVWLDVTDDVDGMQQPIDRMLAASPSAKAGEGIAEEWAIHDYEGFGPLHLDEFVSLTTLSRLAQGIAKHGMAYAAWINHIGVDSDDADTFEDVYRGEWESVVAYAEELLDDVGATRLVDDAPEWIRPYLRLDIDGFARDLQLGGDIVTADRPDGGVWIFEGCLGAAIVVE
jgi:antirestriction protein